METTQQTTSSCDRPMSYVNEVVLSEHHDSFEHAQQYGYPKAIHELVVDTRFWWGDLLSESLKSNALD